MDLPDDLIDRILAAVQSRMPDGLVLERVPRTSHMVAFRITPELRQTLDAKPLSECCQLGVRNRDGITPVSIAWATWLLLDGLIKMSRRLGVPWPRDLATTLDAYAEADANGVSSWISDGDQYRLEVPRISLTDVTMRPASGLRLPFPLPRKHRLPSAGPVTSPGNARG